MMSSSYGGLSDRLIFQVEIALDRDCTCSGKRSIQERRADRLGLTRAEIDAARSRRGFDIKTAAAIDFACAIVSHDPTRVLVASINARSAGIDDAQLADIARLAAGHNATPIAMSGKVDAGQGES